MRTVDGDIIEIQKNRLLELIKNEGHVCRTSEITTEHIFFNNGKNIATSNGEIYSVSSDGIAYRLKPQLNYPGGYYRVSLLMNGKRKYYLVHLLIAQLFLGELRDGYVVHHKDGKKLNNNISNLEILT